jgi:hypothetical protein
MSCISQKSVILTSIRSRGAFDTQGLQSHYVPNEIIIGDGFMNLIINPLGDSVLSVRSVVQENVMVSEYFYKNAVLVLIW